VDIEVQAVAVGPSLGKSLYVECARETTLGHVITWVLIIVLVGVVFHGPHDRDLTMKPSFTRGKLPLTAPTAPVTL
jgi:hypothetical protein